MRESGFRRCVRGGPGGRVGGVTRVILCCWGGHPFDLEGGVRLVVPAGVGAAIRLVLGGSFGLGGALVF